MLLLHVEKEEKKKPIDQPQVNACPFPSSPVGFYNEKGDKQIKQLKARTKLVFPAVMLTWKLKAQISLSLNDLENLHIEGILPIPFSFKNIYSVNFVYVFSKFSTSERALRFLL